MRKNLSPGICFVPFRPLQDTAPVQSEMLHGRWGAIETVPVPCNPSDKLCNAPSISSDYGSNSSNPGSPEIKKSILQSEKKNGNQVAHCKWTFFVSH